MSSKKKNAITMIALVVVLIICLVLYFVIPRGKSSDKDADSSSTSESNSTDSGSDNAKITLDTITSDNISSITLTKKGKQAWKLSQKKKGTWKIDGKESAPVSDDTISSMVKNVNPVKATQKFSAKSGNLSDYGLKLRLRQKTALPISIRLEVRCQNQIWATTQNVQDMMKFTA